MKATIVGRHLRGGSCPEFTLEVNRNDKNLVSFWVNDTNNPDFWMEIEFNMGDLLDTLNPGGPKPDLC